MLVRVDVKLRGDVATLVLSEDLQLLSGYLVEHTVHDVFIRGDDVALRGAIRASLVEGMSMARKRAPSKVVPKLWVSLMPLPPILMTYWHS